MSPFTPTPDFYRHRASAFQQEGERIESRIKLYSWLRVVLALLIGLTIYLGYSNNHFLYAIFLPVIAFIVVVRKQVAAHDAKQRAYYLGKLNRQEADGLNFETTNFPDGDAFADVHHPFSHDLDLFGPGSVFQYLNRSGTHLGESHLAADLKNPTLNEEEIRIRQLAVRELATALEFRQLVWAMGKQINDSIFDSTVFLSWLNEKSHFHGKKGYIILQWILPAITITSLGLVFYSWSFISLFMVLVGVQLAIAGFHSKRITDMQRVLSSGGKIMSNYAKIFELLSHQKFDSVCMQKHVGLATIAFHKVREFSVLVNALESRMNPIAMLFGNGLFLYDLHSVGKLERWREQNETDVPGWLQSLAEWDSLISLATLHYNYPGYAFAEGKDTLTLRTEGVGHLLIPDRDRINNDFEIGNPQRIYLITGANMAGKSTFLRALGVNFVLGQIGSPVCARVWQAPVMTLRTGMRTTDSLQDHQSYFFAELNRLQSIVQELNADVPTLILLDEILKGTNSTDKQLGSVELLKQLKDKNALVVLATHDIALGSLQQQYPQQVATACFEGKIEKDQLTFDYTLHPGVAQRANATFLMRKMGIIPPEAL